MLTRYGDLFLLLIQYADWRQLLIAWDCRKSAHERLAARLGVSVLLFLVWFFLAKLLGDSPIKRYSVLAKCLRDSPNEYYTAVIYQLERFIMAKLFGDTSYEQFAKGYSLHPVHFSGYIVTFSYPDLYMPYILEFAFNMELGPVGVPL